MCECLICSVQNQCVPFCSGANMFVLHSFMGPAVKLLGQVQYNALGEPNIAHTTLSIAIFFTDTDNSTEKK